MTARRKTSEGQGFDNPPERGEEANVQEESWESPPEEGGEEAVTGVEATPEQDMQALGFDQGTMSAFRTIEDWLSKRERPAEGRALSAEALEGDENIVGVALGYGEPDLGHEPGAPVITVFVQAPMPADAVQSIMSRAMGVSPQDGGNTPIQVVVSGPFEAQTFNMRMRPSPCGISLGHYKITAGTQGVLCTGRRSPRDRRLMILSNNHVLANVNLGAIGDPILQPGPYDGGTNPADRIAILESFVPLRLGAGGVNIVDCACAWAWPNLVRREFLYRTGAGLALFRVSSAPVAALMGMLVGKSGRTTELTTGRIVSLTWSGWVGYGASGSAFFRDQLLIQGLSGNFSAGGDSGSLIWTWNATRNPVGLLFAGGGSYTIANKIGPVLTQLDIKLYT